jgi:rRNA-processing protein FCF1
MGYSGGGRRVRILLDTNMLLAIAEGINVIEEIEKILEAKPEFIVIKPVYDELSKLAAKGKPSLSRKARLALRIAESSCTIIDYEYDQNREVDELIVDYAVKNKMPVATNDRRLRRILREKGIPQIYLRDRNIIETDLSEYMLI